MMVRDLAKIQKEITRRRNQLQQVVAVTFPELKSTGLTQREKKTTTNGTKDTKKASPFVPFVVPSP